MLIGSIARFAGVEIRFRAVNNIGMVERHVEISWEEAAQLHHDLSLLLQENSYRVPEEDRRRNLGGGED